jgi:hypothetical protein
MISEAGMVAHMSPTNWKATGKVTQVGSGERDLPIKAVTATSKTLPVLSNALQKERARTPKYIKSHCRQYEKSKLQRVVECYKKAGIKKPTYRRFLTKAKLTLY